MSLLSVLIAAIKNLFCDLLFRKIILCKCLQGERNFLPSIVLAIYLSIRKFFRFSCPSGSTFLNVLAIYNYYEKS